MLRRLSNRRGFTLAEVMTTVTLIAGMGGGGAFLNPKNEAQQQVCLQHLQVIGRTFMLEDLRGQPLPKACFFPKTTTTADSLPKLMGPKVEHLAWLCPCAPVKLQEHKITYVFNSKLGGQRMSEIEEASKTWLLADLCLVDSKLPCTHLDGANILFADGVARFVLKTQFPKLK
jgi:prepilin-type N-terminal cleavage/methylation domain-containing protein/prepilin-type processing-associated H-X9-DG protein